ncbi:MAG: FG-GAP-like repeat-containing protein [Candidatus Zixiibacteriota bacterium]
MLNLLKAIAVTIITFITMAANAQIPGVVAISPGINELNAQTSVNINVTFDVDMNASSINASSFLVIGSYFGEYSGSIAYDDINRVAAFDPDIDFEYGEVVTVLLTEDIMSSDAYPLENGFSSSFTVVSGSGPATFANNATYAVGDWPWDGAAADFDGDGDIDIAAVNHSSGSVSILLNDGSGYFYSNITYPAGSSPSALVAVDLDQDGDIDIAASSLSNDRVSILKNNGSGVFSFVNSYSVGDLPEDICAADFDGDGDIDLATADFGDFQVTVLLNTGAGVFTFGDMCAVGRGSYSICTGDFNNDGHPDLATSNMYDNNISILINAEDTLFEAAVNFASGGQAQSIASADLNGDGYTDIVVSDVTSTSIMVHLNNGDGTFGGPSSYPTGDFPLGVCTGDFDGDGDVDVAVAASQSNSIYVHLNNGDGTFALWTRIMVSRGPATVFPVDVDGDDDLDLGAVVRGQDSLSVLFNQTIYNNVLMVTNPEDSGVGSLRRALDSANITPGIDSIEFIFHGTIMPLTPLPAINGTGPVLLQGSAFNGYPGNVTIDGSSLTTGNGLEIHSSNNLVEGLIIKNFPENGIAVIGETARFNTIVSNRIYLNGLLGIDLGNDGVTVNDSGDSDSGPNDLLNYPVVDSLIKINDTTFIVYGQAEPDGDVTMYLVNSYIDTLALPDPSGHGEGSLILAEAEADLDGHWVISYAGVLNWDMFKINYLTFLVTDTLGNTSEFSENIALANSLQIIAHSPVNLWVTDPNGDFIGRDEFGNLYKTISDAEYPEAGPEENDVITIPGSVIGEYLIEVLAESGAAIDAKYAVGVRIKFSPECMLVVNAGIPEPGEKDSLYYNTVEGWHYLNGDADGSWTINLLDVTFLINYLYKGGPSPEPLNSGDANCNLTVNILDVTYLINYLYKSGSAPCALSQ